MDSIQKGLTQLGTKNYLDLASFKTSAGTQPCDIEDCDVECEDEFADLAWRFEQSLASARLVRLLHLFGWPHRWVGILHSNELAGQTFDDFKEDIRIYLKLGALDHATKKVDNILKRHLFQRLCEWQCIAYGKPRWHWCYTDEDICGLMIEVAQPCHVTTMAAASM